MSGNKQTPEPRTPRPKTIAEAKQVIADAMKINGWDENEQKVYQGMLNVSGFDSERDVRAVIDDLENSNLVLFETDSEKK